MILPTMTLTELAKEIQSDYKEVHAAGLNLIQNSIK